MVRWAAVASFAVAALAGCSGGSKTADTSPHFVASDLARLVLSQPEVPTGTELIARDSGPKTAAEFLDFFTQNDAERRGLESRDLQAAHIALFSTMGLLEEDLTGPLPSGALLIGSYSLVFPDEQRASEALVFIRDETPRDDEDLKPASASGLGAESFGFRGGIVDLPPPGFIFGWRVANAVMLLVVSGAEGTIDAAGALALAERVDARAT